MRPVALILCLALAGCEKGMHDMYDQARYKPFAASRLFADGTSARVPPPATVPRARGSMAGTSSGRTDDGTVAGDVAAMSAEAIPYPLTHDLLEKGRERYEIYCQPCHSPVGDGDGLVVRRGFPAPPSYHIPRLRTAPDRHFFDVITHGYGIMYSYADRVEPADRWAIVAYIRALQLSQGAQVADLPADIRQNLGALAESGR